MRTLLGGIGLGVCLLIAFSLGRLTMSDEISKNSLPDPTCCTPVVLEPESDETEKQEIDDPAPASAEWDGTVAEVPEPIEARLRPQTILEYSAPQTPASTADDAIQRFRSGLRQLELDRKEATQERTK